MTRTLLDAVQRYTEAHDDPAGTAPAKIAGLNLVRTTTTGELQYGIQHALICLVLQGTKDVTIGSRTLSFQAGDSMLITADVPTVSQIRKASRVAPYLSFALDLDLSLIADLCAEMKAAPLEEAMPLTLQPTDAEVADTALRLVRLLNRPASIPVLKESLIREMHYWLLAGRHGPAIRHLGFPDSHARRIGRAVAAIRAGFAAPLRVKQLAAIAGMSPSTFHHHFRSITSLSPLQFQKQLRLIEARRIMLADGTPPSHAAYAVGYESVQQFTREYRRLFGLPPVQETKAARRRVYMVV